MGIDRDVLENYEKMLVHRQPLALPPMSRETTDKKISGVVAMYRDLRADVDPAFIGEMGIFSPQEQKYLMDEVKQRKQVPFPHYYHHTITELAEKIGGHLISYLGRRLLQKNPEFASAKNQEQAISHLGNRYFSHYLSGDFDDGEQDSRLDHVLDTYLDFNKNKIPRAKFTALGIYDSGDKRDLLRHWGSLNSINNQKYPVSYHGKLAELLRAVTEDVTLYIGLTLDRLGRKGSLEESYHPRYHDLCKLEGLQKLLDIFKAEGLRVREEFVPEEPQPAAQKRPMLDLGYIDDLTRNRAGSESMPEVPSSPLKGEDSFTGKASPMGPMKRTTGGIILPGSIQEGDFDKLAEDIANQKDAILGKNRRKL